MNIFLGGLTGVFVQLYSNAVRKLPLMHESWKIPVAFGVGGYVGYKWNQADVYVTGLLEKEKLRRERLSQQ